MTTKTVYGWVNEQNQMFMSSLTEPQEGFCTKWFKVDNVDVDRPHRIEWDGTQGSVVYDIEDFIAPETKPWLDSRPTQN